MIKTSQTWLEYIPRSYSLRIIDPDGWDRENYEYSFNEELVTWGEFMNRLSNSTVSVNISLFTDDIKIHEDGYLVINGEVHMPFTKEIYFPNPNKK